MTQEDDLTVFFRLKPGITFTDGYGTMTADDVKFSIERVADPANESPYAGDWAALAEVEVIDELSGRIHLTEPFAPLWTSTLPTPTCSILSRRAMEELGGRDDDRTRGAVRPLHHDRLGAAPAHDTGPQSRLGGRAGRVRGNPHRAHRRSLDGGAWLRGR
jgi:ABC-type transport system substrate-binding protein